MFRNIPSIDFPHFTIQNAAIIFGKNRLIYTRGCIYYDILNKQTLLFYHV